MKRMLAVLLLLCVGTAWGAVSVVFERVKVEELVRLTYGELLKEPYVVESSALSETAEVSLDVRGLSPESARVLVSEILRGVGLEIVRREGVNVVRRAERTIDEDVLVYRPRYRSAGYLLDVLAPVVGRGAAAVVPAVVGAPPGSQPAGGMQPGGQVAPGLPPTVPARGVGAGVGARADRDLDVFIWRGSSREVERLRRLVVELDRPSGEVVVKAVVYEVRHAEHAANALSIAATLLGGKLGIEYGPAGSLQNALRVSVGSFQAVVSALASDQRFKVLATPSMRVQSGQSARFVVGDETPVLAGVTYQANGQAVQNVDYRPSGVIFDVKPVVRQEAIEVTVFQQLSSFVATATGVTTSPTLLKRELSTTTGVGQGDTIVLAGLEDARTTEEESGLSFLPKWLGSRGRSSERKEVLVVLDVQRVGMQ